MQVKYCKTLMQGQPSVACTQAIAWSPNNKRLAVADAGRFIHVYDEQGERRDKFPTKAADGKGGRGYSVTGLVFSPDSSKIAVAQSDCIVSIYRIGLEWGEKKAITSKFPQTSPVTCIAWPNASSQGVELLVFGTQEGKVKVGIVKSNKSQSLFAHEHPVVSIATNREGNKIVSGYLDGSVYVYVFESEDGGDVSGAKKLFTHTCAPDVLSWGEHICAAGQDAVVTFYNSSTGHIMQSFDYPANVEGQFTAGTFNPSGQAMALASRDRIRFLDYNLRAGKWEEGCVVNYPNSYVVPVLAWKNDGSRLVTGTLTGAVDMFDTCLKRYRLRGKFEFTYVSHNQVIVKRLSNGARIELRSNMGNEIQRVNVHKDRYLVANTLNTLLVGDLNSCALSEVPWHLSGRETFVFDNPQVCMVFTIGELCLIEYGKNTLLGTCRTEERNAHRISVRIHDHSMATTEHDHSNAAATDATNAVTRVIAYLIDRQTAQVDNLVNGITIARISHNTCIDWLELDYRATKLLYRDKQHQLFIFDIPTQQRTTLLPYCTYVQWVPGSDVVVAQNRMELCVWYTITAPDQVTTIPIKGEIEGIERGNNKTEVIVDEGVNTVAYALDEALIEFGVTMEERTYDRACDLLDRISLTPETEAMWMSLSTVALQEMKLRVAERCFAALGDIAKVRALQHVHELAAKASKESGGSTDGYDHYTVRAEMLILSKEFKRAEQLYLENGKPEKAMMMWEEMGRFDASIAIAEARNLPDLTNRRARYFSWLMETKQYERAGEVKEKEGKHMDAINLYLRGGTPGRAATLVTTYNLKPEQQLLEAIAAALFKSQVFEKAGDFFEKLHMNDRAIEAYTRGHVFGRAVEFARRAHPEQVVGLEEAWGDYLVSQKHVDQAINHYTEAGNLGKAVKAAVSSRQWGKAVAILEMQSAGHEDQPQDAAICGYYKTIAHHYEETHQYSEAEKYYVRAGAINDAVEMYSRSGMADHMYRVAQRHLDPQQLLTLFVSQAKQLETKGDYAGAERVYLKVNEPDQAILMYKKVRDFANMVRLVQAYRPDFLFKTHLSLGAQFEKEGNFKAAETHYIAGKDWNRAVNMYCDRTMWDDAMRVAKSHGGAGPANRVIITRALVMDNEEGLQLLIKFNLVESGIDTALQSQKFDLALQWAQRALPSKVPLVYLKNAMHNEDQGDFRMAEELYIKASKPREAIDMYVHQHDFSNAMRVAEHYDQAAIPTICIANGRTCFQKGNYKEAEQLLLRANTAETLLKMYMEHHMFADAQRIAKEYCPDMMSEVAKRIALQSNDPQKAGAVLEENHEYPLAIEIYLNATPQTVPDPDTLAALLVRAVKMAHKHARNILQDTLRKATDKLKNLQRYEDAATCLETCEDYKGAINMYVQGCKFDLAENLAKRISPELVDYVKRAIVEHSINSTKNNPQNVKALEEIDPSTAIKAYVAKKDFDNALRVAKQRAPDQEEGVMALKIEDHLDKNDVVSALEETGKAAWGFGGFKSIFKVAGEVIPILLDDNALGPVVKPLVSGAINKIFNLEEKEDATPLPTLENPNPNKVATISNLHPILVKMRDQAMSSGLDPDELTRSNALTHIIHIYHTAHKMRSDYNFPEFSVKLMLGLPRWIPFIPPEKAFYDAGMAAKEANMDDIAFIYFNRVLDIMECVENGVKDSSAITNTDFDITDFPKQYTLPEKLSLPESEINEMNTWVLTKSIEYNPKVKKWVLPTIKVPGSEEMMFEGSLKAPNGTTYPECAVTGYPVMGTEIARCSGCQRVAKQEDWNRYIVVAKECPWCGQKEGLNFNL